MADRNLVVRVIGDESDYVRSLKRSTAETKQFDNTVTRSATRVDAAFTKINKVRTGAFVGGAVVAAAVAGIKRTTDAASDLNEQISKSRQVFGQSSAEIEAWSKTTAESIGVAQTAALTAVGTFGNLFDAIGIAGPQAAATSRQLVQLAADLASFNNADPSEVLDAIRSGLVGEAEPLRRYGVLLSEARVQQVALSQSGKDSVKALTNQEKALARVSIIFDDTARAQGDFARTSESLANQQRILAARAADLEANLGRLLLPAVTKITAALADATGAALDLSNALAKLGDVKIPPITIPIVGEFGGGDIGGAVGGFLGNALDPKSIALRLHPAGLVADTALEIKKLFGRDADLVIPQLSKDITDTFDSLLTDALKAVQPKKPTVNAADFAKLPGVDFDRSGLITGAIDDVLAGSRKAIADATRKVKAGLRTEELEKAFDEKRDAFASLIAGLELGVDRAELTTGLQNDVAALNDLKAGLERQVRAGVDVQSAQSQLVQVTMKIADTQTQINKNREDAARSRLQASQFRALGLSATGDEFTPSVANLRKQLDALSKSVIDQDVPDKLVNRLAGVRKILSGQFGKATEETRAAIRDLFQTIRGEFDKGSKVSVTTLTKTTALNTDKILQGLGLDKATSDELGARLRRFNTAGMALAAPQSTVGAFGRPILGTSGGVNINGPITVVASNPDEFLRELEKKGARTPGSRSGRFPGRRGGI